jgi:hypothetical protein
LRQLCTDLASLPGSNHLLVGHLDDFDCANPSTRVDAVRFAGQTAAQLRASLSWHSTASSGVPPLEAMNEPQRRGLRALIGRVVPLA